MTILKAGLYYIGDPCYVFNKSWDKFLDAKDKSEDNQVFNDIPFFAAYLSQDLTQSDNYGNTYPIDSVTIGCIPVGMLLVDKETSVEEINKNMKNKEKFFGQIVKFDKSFVCSDEGTHIQIGHFVIGCVEEHGMQRGMQRGGCKY